MDIREVDIDELVLDPNLNLRDKLDEFTVERYADVWERMPPITVYEVDGELLVADGFHRHAAAVHLQKQTIKVDVIQGTLQDALDFVAGANLHHGLPLTRPERRRAVEVKLRIHYDWSDRRMSEELGVSRELVAKIRRQLEEGSQIPSDTGRVGSDGKTYPPSQPAREPQPRGRVIAPEERPMRDEPTRPSRPPFNGGEEGYKEPPFAPSVPRETVDARTAPSGDFSSAPSMDEMLAVMTKQIMEVFNWTQAEGFGEAYRLASANARGLFQTAALKLAARADQLRKGAT